MRTLYFFFRIYDILCDLFTERMPQDTSYKYRPDTVNVYFENRINATIHLVDVRKTIQEITMDPKYDENSIIEMKLSGINEWQFEL